MLFSCSSHLLVWHLEGPTVSLAAVPKSNAITNRPNCSYHLALADQPRRQILPEPLATVVPVVLFLLGQLFVITSTWALGITGTFLGDYFGILMDHRVEGFASFSCVALNSS